MSLCIILKSCTVLKHCTSLNSNRLSPISLNQKLRSISLALSIIFLCSACTVNPVTGLSEISLVSPQQEVAMGKQNYLPTQQAQGGVYQVDPQLKAYISRIGQTLAAKSDRPQLPYEFVVLNNDVPNAWALPGGKIAINRGLLIHLEDEAQLAAVLGHEIVHAAARHAANQMTQNSILQMGVAVLEGLDPETEGGIIVQGATLGATAWQARYGRMAEFEADDYGMSYMSRAGYDPTAAVDLQRIFVQLSQGQRQDFIAGLFASHPPSQARVDANIKRAANLTGNIRNRQQYQQAIKQLKQDASAYEDHQQALEAIKNRDYSKAESLVAKAIKQQSNENHFWETRARVDALNNDLQAAEQSYNQAIKLYPQFFRPYLSRASLYKAQERYALAEKDLLTSQQYLPTQSASFMLGEISLKLDKKSQAIDSFRQAAAAGGQLGNLANQELQKLGVNQSANSL